MQVSDPTRETAVWARVYSEPDGGYTLPAQLAKWIVACHENAVSYYYLARLAPRDGPALRRLAQNCAGQGVTLSALYMTLTHRQPPRPPAVADVETDPAPLFTALYQREAEGAREMFGALHDGVHDEVLRRQAVCQQNRAADLLEISTKYL